MAVESRNKAESLLLVTDGRLPVLREIPDSTGNGAPCRFRPHSCAQLKNTSLHISFYVPVLLVIYLCHASLHHQVKRSNAGKMRTHKGNK